MPEPENGSAHAFYTAFLRGITREGGNGSAPVIFITEGGRFTCLDVRVSDNNNEIEVLLLEEGK